MIPPGMFLEFQSKKGEIQVDCLPAPSCCEGFMKYELIYAMQIASTTIT